MYNKKLVLSYLFIYQKNIDKYGMLTDWSKDNKREYKWLRKELLNEKLQTNYKEEMQRKGTINWNTSSLNNAVSNELLNKTSKAGK